MKRRVLFVDDEAYILDGLRNLLRKQRQHWDMRFALGGQEALAELAKEPCDVIVSDMRMPGMDGATLLSKVKEEYPHVARIVLSGHAEREAVVKVLPVAHQYLSKPCDVDVLRGVVDRACNLQALLHDTSIRKLIGNLTNLPSAPNSYWELTNALSRDDVGVGQVARIIESDPAMAVKVLQVVNSAYFGLAQHITSIQQAVTYLGMEVLRGLSLTAHVFGSADALSMQGFSLEQLQKRSVLTGRLARRLVGNSALAEEAFATGTVHDIGKLVLAVGLPDRFGAVVQAAAADGRPVHEVEQEALGVTHAQVGGYLLGVWGLPFTMVEAVSFHHSPSQVAAGERTVLAAVHVADALVDAVLAEAAGRQSPDIIDVGFLESIGRAEELPTWRRLAQEEVAVREAA